MKALISAFALLAFVGASTVPFAAQAQGSSTTAPTTAKKAPAKKSTAKKSTKKKTASKKTSKPATSTAPKTM